MQITRRFSLGIVLSSLVLYAGNVHAGEGVSEKEVRVGMSAALSGAASALGQGMKSGIDAYFQQVNAAGGVGGRTLRLIALDDGYEPGKTGPNMRKLTGPEDVFVVLGNTGTPTGAVAIPIANETKVPLFGAYTGAGILRKSPPDRYVWNYRASYAQETAEMVRGLIQELGILPRQFAFFTQNDAYGDAGYAGGVKALVDAGYAAAARLPHGRYPRNTVDVERGLAKLLDPRNDVKAVIMVGAYKPCAKFIKLAKKHGLRAVFANVSFVGSDALNSELGADGDNVVVTQVVPHYDGSDAATVEYRKAIPKDQMNFISFEGYLAAKAFVLGLRRVADAPTRERFIDALESGAPIDLGLGTTHTLSKSRHQLSDRVWPTVLKGGKFYPLKKWSDLPKP